jgi:NitT/TauT family transport system substrate-binding protein
MRIVKKITLLIVLTALLVSVPSAQDLDDETLLMTFIPNIQFAPMYMAIGGGYFADAGLNVSLEYLNEPDVIDLVAADRNQFGVVSGEQVILAAASDRPITYVYEWFQQYPIGVVYSDKRDIESAADLAGLTVGIPGRFGASYSGFTTLIEAADLTESDVQLEEIGFAAPDVFCVGRVDASVIYVNNEPLQIRNRAQAGDCGAVEDVNVLSVGDLVDLVSNGIITNQTTLENEPERVRALVTGFDAGLQMTINNPARAYLVSADFVEGLPLDDTLRAELESLADQQDEFLLTEPTRSEIAESRRVQYDLLAESIDADTLIQFEVLLASIELWDAERLGFSDLDSWTNMQATLQSLDLLETTLDLDALYTNVFVPETDD